MGVLQENKVPPALKEHGTAVCDGGACQHRDGGCSVQQATEIGEVGKTDCEAYEETDRTQGTPGPSNQLVCPTVQIPQDCTDGPGSQLVCPAVQIPRDYHKINATAEPSKTHDEAVAVTSSGYNTASDKTEPEELPKAEPIEGTSPNATPSASFVHVATQNNLTLPTASPGKPAAQETSETLLTDTGEIAHFKRLGTTLPSLYKPFKYLYPGNPDLGGGKNCDQLDDDDYVTQLSYYITAESTWDVG